MFRELEGVFGFVCKRSASGPLYDNGFGELRREEREIFCLFLPQPSHCLINARTRSRHTNMGDAAGTAAVSSSHPVLSVHFGT